VLLDAIVTEWQNDIECYCYSYCTLHLYYLPASPGRHWRWHVSVSLTALMQAMRKRKEMVLKNVPSWWKAWNVWNVDDQWWNLLETEWKWWIFCNEKPLTTCHLLHPASLYVSRGVSSASPRKDLQFPMKKPLVAELMRGVWRWAKPSHAFTITVSCAIQYHPIPSNTQYH